MMPMLILFGRRGLQRQIQPPATDFDCFEKLKKNNLSSRLFRSTFPKARGIEAEMSCRRREGAGQSGSFAAVEAQGGCELQRKARRPAGARAQKTKRFSERFCGAKCKDAGRISGLKEFSLPFLLLSYRTPLFRASASRRKPARFNLFFEGGEQGLVVRL